MCDGGSVVYKYKYTIGYYLTHNAMQAGTLVNIIEKTVGLLEQEGFNVLGLTSDQGSNFSIAFRILGSTSSHPEIDVNGKRFLVLK